MTLGPRSTSPFQQNRVTEAVILMAGSGSRLRGADKTFLKPMVPILGRPLISYTIDALVKAGTRKINAVVGFEGQRLSAAVVRLIPSGSEFCIIKNPEWQKQNGVSLLTAAKRVEAPFVLAMSDHLFDPVILERLIESADPSQLNVAIDRKIDSIFDLDDAMKVQTHGDRIVAIGKTLKEYDAVDIGLFICPREIFDYLERSKLNGDCSLADGVRSMAEDQKVRAIDIGEAWWQDVDTPEMLREAEEKLRALARN
jgi:choline kinase